ncbi:MAG: hypothetical protein QG580_455 [Patescibacteria group bacterium]|nr:hypothetical protein [Patescibacteria group bacterium]
MKNSIFLVLTVTLIWASCTEKPEPLTCGEWTSSCELQKDYVYFRVDSVLVKGVGDALGFPIEEGHHYIMSTKTKSPIGTVNPAQSQTIYVGLQNRTIRYTTESLLIGGGKIRVRLYLFGEDEVRPGQADLVWSSVHSH